MRSKILRISLLPLMLMAGLVVADFQQNGNGKGKGGKENRDQGRGNENPGQNKGHQQADNQPHENGNKDRGVRQGPDRGKGNDHNRGNDNKGSHGNESNRNNKADNFHSNKNKGRSNSEVINWRTDKDLDWGFANFSERKRPGSFKNVTICHTTGNNLPVTITVSENALNAHLNHGDRTGTCTTDYGVWTPRYIRTRENVYNIYEQTWERMSYSEALLAYAVQRLLGLRTDLDRARPTLTVSEVQRREVLITDLQNDVNYLQTSVADTRSALNGVNINIIF